MKHFESREAVNKRRAIYLTGIETHRDALAHRLYVRLLRQAPKTRNQCTIFINVENVALALCSSKTTNSERENARKVCRTVKTISDKQAALQVKSPAGSQLSFMVKNPSRIVKVLFTLTVTYARLLIYFHEEKLVFIK
ncbi:PREDICTED: uncharacterized protein LOC108359045 [Rhagoletis zephyria]|uniref:uncharacterized protein LOC108359045 n=1 Tax=Rhagoletis zephyria TaxID=28612 RepID=UPI000811337B|nr:PREDICTED: uncharacterized protein LOC108359045 [Rhagoletis zephyria]